MRPSLVLELSETAHQEIYGIHDGLPMHGRERHDWRLKIGNKHARKLRCHQIVDHTIDGDERMEALDMV